MSLLGLLNQTITIYPVSSRSGDGREVFGTGVSVKARFQIPKRRNTMPRNIDGKSTLIEIDAVAYVPSDTTVETDNKVTYESIDYKVVTKYAVPGMTGTTHHIRLELKKWQSV